MHHTHHPTQNAEQDDPGTSVLVSLRALLPNRRLRLSEALRIAELQAVRLRQLTRYWDAPIPSEIITDLPRIIVEHDPELPGNAASGCSDWDSTRRAWVILLNPDEPETRQRFTMLHEYKHILDHYGQAIQPITGSRDPAEIVADYFAGCVLMPKQLVKAAYYDGIQRVPDLAQLFDVSPRAIEVRLDQVGLTWVTDSHPSDRIRYWQSRPRGTRNYYRSRSSTWLNRKIPKMEAVQCRT